MNDENAEGLPVEGLIPLLEVLAELDFVADGASMEQLTAIVRRLVANLKDEDVPEFVGQMKRLRDATEQVVAIVQESVAARG